MSILEDTGGERRKGTAWERHVQTIILTLITAGVIWIASTVHNLEVKVAVLSKDLSGKISLMQEKVRSFTEQESLVQEALIGRIEALENRNVNITSRIRKNEDRIRDYEQRLELHCLKQHPKGIKRNE